MLSVHVFGKLNANSGQKFNKCSLNNAKNSVLEPHVSRFDVLRKVDADDFLLIEVYNTADGPGAHKETAHYNEWRDTVAPMMAEPRVAKKYRTIFPAEQAHWDTKPAAGDIDVETYSSRTGGTWSASLDESFEEGTGMFAVVVDVQVTPGSEEAFIAASLDNCKNSIKEAGVTRFDLMQNTDDSANFALVEVYNTADAPAAHKATAHYAAWAAAVTDMMARPRQSSKWRTLFPSPKFWK